MNLEYRGHPRKLCQRIATHSSSQTSAMHLDRLLGYSQLRSNFFVQKASSNQYEDLALPRR